MSVVVSGLDGVYSEQMVSVVVSGQRGYSGANIEIKNIEEIHFSDQSPSQLLKFVDFTNNTCPLCLKRFNRKDHVQRHYMELHMSPKVFECSKCHRKYKRSCRTTFKSRGKLVAHMKLTHHLDMILQ
ncbi:hypothetical protein JTB14_010329 [Gonioctena quinquepunctata]|nr:hypothetical protein JTB14_010329 [Gonioctena quinquepunctata]